ncbi:MAG: chemotaxis response regulator protein-glutamate methylesterase [Cyclobacteriaceae bacterium]
MSKKIKILIVDDSLLVRKSLAKVFSEDDDLEVIGEAIDPYMAVKELKKMAPDVITLDIEMPKMDGITFLKKLMSQHPIPVVVISTLTQKGTNAALKALEYGAVEVLPKPKVNTREELLEKSEYLRRVIKSAAKANLSKLSIDLNQSERIPSKIHGTLSKVPTKQVVAIGASTGGTTALKMILKGMSALSPGVVVVQHMPEMFTKQFADRLNTECEIAVSEAQDGDRLYAGHALIAPGNKHMMLKGGPSDYRVQIMDGPRVNHHKPSIDVLFKSVARYAKNKAIGVLLTGMGKDGAIGLLEMKNNGAHNIAQNEKTSVVFGMPKEAIKLGAAHEVLAIEKIGEAILNQRQSK